MMPPISNIRMSVEYFGDAKGIINSPFEKIMFINTPSGLPPLQGPHKAALGFCGVEAPFFPFLRAAAVG